MPFLDLLVLATGNMFSPRSAADFNTAAAQLTDKKRLKFIRLGYADPMVNGSKSDRQADNSY
jgi:hypothetical protein